MVVKKTLVACTIFIFAISAYSQAFQPYWNIGIGFGPSLSSVDFARSSSTQGSAFSTKNKGQINGGVAVRYISEKNLGFIAEINYSQQGWEQNFSKDNSLREMGLKHSHQLDYIEMPILTHIYFGRKLRFIINLGPKVGYLISQKEELNDALINYLSSGNVDGSMVTHQYYRKTDRNFDYGLMGGMGMEYQTKIGSFSLEGRYYFGLADIYNNSKKDYFYRSANRVMSIRLTYYVKLF